MEFGVMAEQTEAGMRPDKLAAAAEQRGFRSIWFSDHSHIPTNSTPFPMGGDIPAALKELYDPLICLAAAATATTTIELGTAVLLMAQRDPITTAKEISTIDQISEGRVKVGVGFGWNRAETANHSVDPSQRWAVVRERVLAMKSLWTQDVADFSGEHVHIEPSWQWPKPVQHPHPPIYIGGVPSPKTLARVVSYGEGWIPLGIDGLGTAVRELEALADERGRVDAIDIVPILPAADPADHESVDVVAQLGIGKVVFGLPAASEKVLLDLLDRFAKCIAH